MPHLTTREVLEVQEHIRTAAAHAHSCQQMAQQCQDTDLQQILQQEVLLATRKIERLTTFFNPTH